MLRPRDEADLADCIAECRSALEPVGGGSKRAIGRPVEAEILDLSALSGIVGYHPEELVLTARAATPLDEIRRALAAAGQRLAFEPPDFGALLQTQAMPTIGGTLCANLAGSRRIAAGAARDHFLGFRAVSGRGERFKAGGKVVKNVTGYDLPKLLAGSWGTLAVLTEVTIRAVPAPECERTLRAAVMSPEEAVRVMTQALGSPHEVSSAAFEPEQGVYLRLEGFAPSVEARVTALARSLSQSLRVDDLATLEDDASRSLWARLGDASDLASWPVVWRVSVPPGEAVEVLRSIEPERYHLDWGGGSIWIGSTRLDAVRVRGAIRNGHATLIKASAADRAATATFHPPAPAVAALITRLKAAFDPEGRLNPGRMD